MTQPLQPHQAVHSWSEAEVTDTQSPVRLLPVPATSALAAHSSHSSAPLLSQQSSQFESDSMTHGMSRQPPADECLFGSPPRGQNDNHVHHSTAHRTESVYQVAVGGVPLLSFDGLGTKPEGLEAAVAAEKAHGSAILMTEDSEQSFRELLQAAQQQRVCVSVDLVAIPSLSRVCLSADLVANQSLSRVVQQMCCLCLHAALLVVLHAAAWPVAC